MLMVSSAVVLTFFLCAPSGGALTRVEKKRLQAAVQAQRGAPAPLPAFCLIACVAW